MYFGGKGEEIRGVQSTSPNSADPRPSWLGSGGVWRVAWLRGYQGLGYRKHAYQGFGSMLIPTKVTDVSACTPDSVAGVGGKIAVMADSSNCLRCMRREEGGGRREEGGARKGGAWRPTNSREASALGSFRKQPEACATIVRLINCGGGGALAQLPMVAVTSLSPLPPPSARPAAMPNDEDDWAVDDEASLLGAPAPPPFEQLAPADPPLQTGSAHSPPLSLLATCNLCAFWAAYQFYWLLVSIVIVPAQIEAIAGSEHKGTALSLVAAVAGFLNLFLAIIMGALNDRFTSKYGRRLPWVILGATLMCLTLPTLWPTDTLAGYVFGYAALTASTVVASVPYNGLIADVAGDGPQRSRVSAVMGAFNLGGYLLGAIVGVFALKMGTPALYGVMVAVMCVGTGVTLWTTREGVVALGEDAKGPIRWRPFLVDMVRPLWAFPDFAMVFASRFCFQLAIATFQQFLQ
ncbi:hypothetical protein BDK51DRAFT_51334 [Blyttiomyces helicus]|uniref:Major facilitator superfamily domain-containing protein n=1 Tax=Blyttiomyces helicus TaxID=388810 RepID=A0A4P9W6Z2_9FUNG|nr:hypothetical protein BDK51DRAFT_51334 [Blyttiomyces helicus]|eukprot:RKO88104.1 hypothetical protein BDK51DRAFT_51334 [Blyttiomyces helicus]